MKRKISKITSSLLCIALFLSYAYWYPAPNLFTAQNYLPVLGFIGLAFLATASIVGHFQNRKKTVLISLLIIAALLIKRSNIIAILLFAICLPLLFLASSKEGTQHAENTEDEPSL